MLTTTSVTNHQRTPSDRRSGGVSVVGSPALTSPWFNSSCGLKPTYLKEHGHTVLNRALPDDDFDEAVRIAQAEFNQHKLDCRWFACPLLFKGERNEAAPPKHWGVKRAARPQLQESAPVDADELHTKLYKLASDIGISTTQFEITQLGENPDAPAFKVGIEFPGGGAFGTPEEIVSVMEESRSIESLRRNCETRNLLSED